MKEKLKDVVLSVKVIPGMRKNEVISFENGVLKVKIAAAPEKGEANEELIRFLAKILNIGKSQIQLTHGLASRSKRILIRGVAQEKLDLLINR